jgi:2-polyprenyl-6-methoxyphenol hydroxylase-like FAD-dependent oxidoreductase
VGLTLAIDLGNRGIRTLLVDEKPAPQFLPKMERCNARTMELYRRMGLADRIRSLGFPPEASMNICVTNGLSAPPLLTLRYPTVAEYREQIAGCEDGSLPLEPYQVVSQFALEPFLRGVAEATPNVEVRFGTALTSFSQDESRVTARLARLDGGEEEVIADYLVGCDGGRSVVRKQLGFALQGEGSIAKRVQVLFRCDRFFQEVPYTDARMFFINNPDKNILVVQGDRRYFGFHTDLPEGSDYESAIHAGLGVSVPIEVIAASQWTLHLLVAERYMDRRVFLAGDAVHLVIPSGGLGLNTGIGDAIDLSWKLAATLQGWGGPMLLASYEAERLAVGRRNRAASGYAAAGQERWRSTVTPLIAEDSPAGNAFRADIVRMANVEQRKTHELHGTELGYRYEGSPVVCDEAGESPPDQPLRYLPTTWPGARLPHVWRRDATPLHDQIGAGYTLLRLGGNPNDTRTFEAALGAMGAPVTAMTVEESDIREVYERDFVLVRPDLHVAWRGNVMPGEPERIAALVAGY